MKICNHCNAENLDASLFCESCGVKFEEAELKITEAEEIIEEPIISSEEPSSINTTPTDWRPAFNNFNGIATNRNHGGLMAFSIINICSVIFTTFTLYASIFTAVFGIIAIVNLNKAKQETNDEYYKIHRKNALILNVVGLIISLIGFLCFMGLVAYIVANGLTELSGFGTLS